MKKLFIIGLGVFHFLNNVSGQTTAQRKSDYDAAAKSMNLLKDPNYYFKYHISLDKVNELKEEGFDLIALDKKAGELSYQEAALLTDVVVSGTLIAKEYNADKNVLYHTTYKLKVETVYKGKSVPAIISINLVSGMSGENYITASNEPDLYLGDRALFFLRYIDFESIQNDVDKGISMGRNNVLKENAGSNFTLTNKYSIRANAIFNYEYEKIADFDKAVETIKRLNEINESGSTN
ncbi:MAG TPA: hypothetical protein VLB84_10065 [Bacteroidia bacterium]|nr:hypothetical protein [Bacteroidia bacterium]